MDPPWLNTCLLIYENAELQLYFIIDEKTKDASIVTYCSIPPAS
jgi:uncharacterized protein YhbP (UPF0306 family)